MCDLTHPFALVAEKLLLKGDRDAEEALCGVHISTVREADAMLNLLEQVVRAPHEHCDDGIMYFVRFLEYPGSSAAAEQLLRRGLPLFDSLAGRLPATSWAWGQILHAMAHWANRGSTESLRCWLSTSWPTIHSATRKSMRSRSGRSRPGQRGPAATVPDAAARP